MTNNMMNLRALVEKTPDAVVLREMIGFAAERLMEAGVATGPGYGEKDPLRLDARNDLIRRRPFVPTSIELLVAPQNPPIVKWLEINQS